MNFSHALLASPDNKSEKAEIFEYVMNSITSHPFYEHTMMFLSVSLLIMQKHK